MQSLPDHSAGLDGCLTSKPIGYPSGEKGAEPGAAGHGGCDTALKRGVGAPALACKGVVSLDRRLSD